MDSISTQSYRPVPNAVGSDSDSSDSDSGDDVWKRSSRKRVVSSSPVTTIETKLPPSADENVLKRRKFNTVWCNVLQEQTVADDLVQFGLKSKPVSYQDRSCESYDFRLSALDPRGNDEPSAMDEDISGSKDTSDEVQFGEDPNENSEHKNNSQCCWPKIPRENKDVVDKVAKRIIRVLNEPKHFIIYRVVQILGTKRALEILEETEKIEDSGGMLVVDNSRRRTPGGTFLQLIKKDTSISSKKKSKIFAEDRRVPPGKMRKKPSKHSKKKKKNVFESMDIICEFADNKDKEESVEQNDSSHGSGPNVQDIENVSAGNGGHCVENNYASNGTGVHDMLDSNGGETGAKDKENTCVKDESELEEGEITD